MVTLELSIEEAEYLSVLVAQDIRNDQEWGRHRLIELHTPTWEKLKTAADQD